MIFGIWFELRTMPDATVELDGYTQIGYDDIEFLTIERLPVVFPYGSIWQKTAYDFHHVFFFLAYARRRAYGASGWVWRLRATPNRRHPMMTLVAHPFDFATTSGRELCGQCWVGELRCDIGMCCSEIIIANENPFVRAIWAGDTRSVGWRRPPHVPWIVSASPQELFVRTKAHLFRIIGICKLRCELGVRGEHVVFTFDDPVI